MDEAYQVANDLALNKILEKLQDKDIEVDEKTLKVDLSRKDAEELTEPIAKDVAYPLPATVTGVSITRLKLKLKEYFGKTKQNDDKKKKDDSNDDKPPKEMLDVIQGTDSGLSNEEELERTTAEKDLLKGLVRKIKSAANPYYFAYFDVGVDSFPIMLIRKKKIPSADLKVLRGKAAKKKMVVGRVFYDKNIGRLTFDVYTAPAKLEKSLKVYFGALLPLFRKAVLNTDPEVRPDDADMLAEDVGPDTQPKEPVQAQPPEDNGEIKVPPEVTPKMESTISGYIRLKSTVKYEAEIHRNEQRFPQHSMLSIRKSTMKKSLL